MLHSHLTTLNAVSLVLNAFKAEGLSSEALLAGSGISAADLSRADTRITTNQEMQVCANAVALKHDIGLELGRRMHVSSYGILGYALLTCATFGDALRLAMHYPALLGTLFELSLEDDGERIWFVAADYRESPALAAFNAEFCLVSLKVTCDDLLGHPLPLLAARFEHAAPDYEASYAEHFICPLHFGARDNAFAFDKRWLDQPLPLADVITHQAMAERCRKQNTEFTGRQAWLGTDSPTAQRAVECRARAGRAGRTDELLGAHLAPTSQGSGVQLSGIARRTALRTGQANALRGSTADLSNRRSAGFQRDREFRHAFVRWSGVAPSQFRP
jgi:hypothetical protein